MAAAVWTGATDNNWRTDANWTPTDWPGNGYGDGNDEAVFDVGTTGNVSPNITGGTNDHVYLQTIQITGMGSTSYTFTGDRQLVIKADGGVTVDSTVTTDQTFTVMVRPDNGTTTYTNNGSGILEFRVMQAYWSPSSFQANVAFDGTGEITVGRMVNRDGNRTIRVQKTGTGTLLFNGNNDYSGTTTVNNGVLRIEHDSALGATGTGTAKTRINGGGANTGRVELAGGITTAETFELSMRKDSAEDAPHLSNLSGSNVITGAIRGITGGAYQNIESQAGHLELQGGFRQTTGTGTRRWRLMGDGDGTVSGQIANGTAGDLRLYKLGAGTWTLSGNNTYTGGTIVEAGTLRIGDGGTSGTLGNDSDTFVADGALLEINRTDQYGYRYGGKLSGSGTVVIPAAGRRLDFDVAQPDSGNLSFVVDGRLASRAIGQEIHLGELSGSGTLTIGGGTPVHPIVVVGGKNTDSTFSGTIMSNVNLKKVGSGALTLTGTNNSYTGGTIVDAGTLLVSNTAGSGTGSGTVAVTGGTLGGTGTVGGDTTIAGGGTLSPGESIGMLTFAPGADLTLDAGAAIDWEFDKPGTPGIDYDSITGDALYLPEAGPIELSIFGPSANLTPGDSFTLFDGDVYDHNSTLFAAGHVFEDLFNISDHSGWWGTWEVSVDSLVLTAVPEPGACLLLLSALACGLLWRRRR